MEYELRPIAEGELPAYRRVESIGFGWLPRQLDLDSFAVTFELDRSLAVFQEGQLVATTGAFSFDLTLPGLTVIRAPGIAHVAVLPTHRRRGLLRAMLHRQLDQIVERGEALAILTASESSIYHRFGFGIATSALSMEIDQSFGAFARPLSGSGRLSLLDAERATSLLPPIYDRARRLQPGAVSRSERWWRRRFDEHQGPNATRQQHFRVVYQSAPQPAEGYVSYTIERHRQGGIPGHLLKIGELITCTSEARAALWHYCLTMDLVRTVQAWNCPTDEPLRWLLADPRRLRVTRLGDELWVRLLDLPAALAARRYATEDDLVIAVTDPFRPATTGTYALQGGQQGAVCRRTDTAPDLALDVADLGAVYLGGVRWSTLARSGRVAEITPGALLRADALFACEPAPWLPDHF